MVLGASGLVVATVAQLVGRDNSLRPLWTALLVVGVVVAVPGLVLQSPWWRDRQRAAQGRIERRLADERQIGTTARGVPGVDWTGSYFTGRVEALRALSEFVADGGDDRVRAVVGRPGSGKSAVIGRLWELSRQSRRGAIDGVLYARGRDATQILQALAEYAGVTQAPSAVLAEELLLALRDRRRALTVVIDALDEAVDPPRVIREVIRPMLDSAPEVGIRLVLGLRHHLLRLLKPPPGSIVDLDSPEYFDESDVAECARLWLTAGASSPYRTDPGHAGRVAAAIADQAGRVFLIAQLTARALARDPAVVDPAAPGWRSSVPSQVGTAMDALLDRFGESTRLRELLVPLAFAEGAGLPAGSLWASLASALGTSAYTEQHVRWLVSDHNPAASLLQATDPGDGDRRYRLFHDALAEPLRDSVAGLAPQSSIVRALLSGVPQTAAGTPDWRAAHPYVTSHLAGHAARADRLDALLADPDFLLAAEPDPLLRVLHAARDRAARRSAAVYRGVVHQLRDLAAGEAAALLELYARQQGHHELAERIAAAHPDRPWSVVWTRARPVHPHQVVGRHDDDVNAIAVTEMGDRWRIVCGDAGGRVGVWDAEHGTRLAEPLAAPEGEISAVAAGRLPDGTTIVVFGGDGGLWAARPDGADRRRIGTQTEVQCVAVAEHDGGLSVIAGYLDGRLGIFELDADDRATLVDAHTDRVTVLAVGRGVVASGATDGSVAVWDLTSGAQVAALPSAATEAVAALAVPPGDPAAPIVIVAGLDGVVRDWDLATRRVVATRVVAYDGWLNCLSLASFGGSRAVVGGAMDGRALVWLALDEPGTAGRSLPPDAALAGHDGWITSVTTIGRDDRDLVVTGGLDGTVRTWDLDDADLLSDRGDAHDGEVTSLSALSLDGNTVAVSGGTDGTVRLWRLTDGVLLFDPIPAHDQGVRAVATAEQAGRPIIASGGSDGVARLWDAATGKPVGVPLIGAEHIRAVVLLSIGERLLLVTGGDRGLRCWDAIAGVPIGDPLARDQPIRSLAAAVVGGRPMVVAGGDLGVSRWDPLAGEPIGDPLSPGVPVAAVALGRVRGQPVILADRGGRAVGFRHALTGAPIGDDLAADYPVHRITVAEAGDHPVAVVGDDRGLTVHPLRGQRRPRRISLGFRATALAAVTSSDLLVGSLQGLYRLRLAEER